MTTPRGLLQALGLPSVPNATPAAAKPQGLDDDALAKALKSLPSDPPKRVEALADLVTKVSDKARRDPVVRALRDAIVKIQPLMPDADAKKKIDEAITDLVDKGVKAGIMALLKAVVGKEPTKVDRDAPPTYGPRVQTKDLGEKMIVTPELPLPFDKAPKVKRNSFELLGLKRSYKPSKYFDFKLRTPDWFEPNGHMGAGWVVIASKEDFDKSGGRPRVRDKHIETRGELSLSLAAPDDPGTYVLFIVVGSGAESHPVHEFEVAK